MQLKRFQNIVTIINPDDYDHEKFFFNQTLSAKLDLVVQAFFEMTNDQIIARYKRLNPLVDVKKLKDLLNYVPSYFFWAGADLMKVTNSQGKQKMVVIEVNSCPSGSKYMPFDKVNSEGGAFQFIIEKAFKRLVDEKSNPSLGGLAVVCDKNPLDTLGYAMTIAKIMNEKVWLVEYYGDNNSPILWSNGVMFVKDNHNVFHPIRACFKYFTQKPWSKFPIKSKTFIFNNILACLCGGRNKMMASYAFELFNNELLNSGLEIRSPRTIYNVSKVEIPKIINKMGSLAVIKIPYSNAGQGVYTITNSNDLQEFMNKDHYYNKFIVQSMIGCHEWFKQKASKNQYFHLGMMPNKKNEVFVNDFRLVIVSTSHGFRPVSIFGRKAHKPLEPVLGKESSWDMLGTNLSNKLENGRWELQTDRLVMMTSEGFKQLGVGIDDLIEGFIQGLLSVIAIDQLCQKFCSKGKFDVNCFSKINLDLTLVQEIFDSSSENFDYNDSL